MIKLVAVFLFVFVLFYLGIEAFNRKTNVQKWDVAKTFSYSLALALAVVVFLVSIVVLF